MIKVLCSSCKTTIKAKESLAGQRVKCPKCRQPMVVPSSNLAKQPSAPRPKTATTATSQGHNPLLDLLDEAGVESMPQGPMCPK